MSTDNNYRYEIISKNHLLDLVIFLNEAFDTTKFSKSYLNNLYFKESSVIGYNVYDGKKLIAHYCVVKKNYSFSGDYYRIGWSINTSIHKEYRGKGFFLELANKTYDLAKEEGIEVIVGVSNKKSTKLFLKQLNFESKGNIRWNIDFFSIYRRRDYFPENLNHLRFLSNKKNIKSVFRLPLLKIYSERSVSFFCLYLSSRKPIMRLGFQLPNNWFKSNWQVICLNLSPDSQKTKKFIENFSIDIGESDTF